MTFPRFRPVMRRTGRSWQLEACQAVTFATAQGAPRNGVTAPVLNSEVLDTCVGVIPFKARCDAEVLSCPLGFSPVQVEQATLMVGHHTIRIQDERPREIFERVVVLMKAVESRSPVGE